jgi:hypothetical protein
LYLLQYSSIEAVQGRLRPTVSLPNNKVFIFYNVRNRQAELRSASARRNIASKIIPYNAKNSNMREKSFP